jgi:hypothetical protein
MSGSKPANPNHSTERNPARYFSRCSMELIKPLSLQGKNAKAKRIDHDGSSAGEQTPPRAAYGPPSINGVSKQHPAQNGQGDILKRGAAGFD